MGVALPAFLPPNYDAAFLASAASQSIRGYCHWHVAPSITETLVLDGAGGKTLLVPSMHITALTKVTSGGTDVTSRVKWSRRSGVLTLASGWSHELGDIEVELTHGFDLAEVPNLAAIVVAIGQRASAGNGGFVNESAGGMSRRVLTGKDGASAGVPLFESEMAALDPYRLTWGT